MNKSTTRQTLAKNAIALFKEKGYDNVSVDEIASGCSKTRTFFYHYFKSKEDLTIYLSEIEGKNLEKVLKEVENVYVKEPYKRLRKLFIDKMTFLYYSDLYRIAVKNDLFNKIEHISLIQDKIDKEILRQSTAIIEEGVRLGCFIVNKDVASFLEFYQKMQKGIEYSFVDEEDDGSFLRNYSIAVDLLIKAISTDKKVTADILDDMN